MKSIANWKQCASVVAGLTLTVMASSANAAWSFAGAATSGNFNGNTMSVTDTGLGVTATLSAFSVANNGAGKMLTSGSGSDFAAAQLRVYDGTNLGVLSGVETAGSAPNHAMDNKDRTEMILVSFKYTNGSFATIDLDRIKLGWLQTDSDMSVLRYTGKTAPTTTGANWSSLQSGWELVGDYANVLNTGTGTGVKDTTGSSWWLISAFNTGFGGSTTANKTMLDGLDMGNDYFKIASLVGTVRPSKVPEPSSMALMGLALLAMLGMRRRTGRAR